ncbi:uncharacterized protein LOC111604547 [Drosophila hydei]|uniref:Uncharacterized protein LOC111604547 n=1 Tax=Drosophila hydei TaxID=7224 RepID=A0A6J1MH28_DROHY|nr:uncharacterized protein LOC111604547 [Drosophila hydei]
MANRTDRLKFLKLLLLLSAVFLNSEAAPIDAESHAATDQPNVESRAQKQDQDILDLDEDLDGRSAYVNNQFVPSDPVDLLDDEQNTPLYEILQKQMEQVLASTGPDVPIYEDEKTKRQRVQQPPNKPIFTTSNAADADEDYVDEIAPELEEGLGNVDKPDAAAAGEELPDVGYQAPLLPSPSTTIRIRPQRRRTTTQMPRTTRSKASQQTKLTTTTPANQTELPSTTTAAPVASNKPRPQAKPNLSSSNMLPHDPQIYQHKRRIIFKTISTGSQFVNSPIGDLMIKFSIGFAKPAPGMAPPSNEALRALSQNLLRSIEMQKLRRINKTQRH